jgi:hypothetical protein
MRSLLLFGLFIVLTSAISWAFNVMVLTEDVYYTSLSEQLSVERIEELLRYQGEWNWVAYIIRIPFYGVKLFLIAICLLTGIFFLNKKSTFGALFKVALKAEFVLLFPSLITLVWFGVFKSDAYTFSDIGDFAPLSLLNITGTEDMEGWQKYLLRSVNAFELLYIGMLAYGLSEVMENEFGQSIKIVLASYGSALLLWTVFVVFMIINFSS